MVHSRFRHLPKDVQDNRLRNGRISVTTTTLGLRATSPLHEVPYATLRRYILFGETVSVQGRHPCGYRRLIPRQRALCIPGIQ